MIIVPLPEGEGIFVRATQSTLAKLGQSPRRLLGVVICVVGVVLLVLSLTNIISNSSSQPQQMSSQPEVAAVTSVAQNTSDPPTEQIQPNNQSTQKPQTKPQTQAAGQTEPAVSEPNQTLQVSLHINDSYMGQVSVKDSSNQCDVLTAALSQGVIHNLDMRWFPDIKSYGVFVINDVGDPKSVWWAYTVNNQSPSGCSYTKVQNGDNINWQYQK